MSTFLVLHSYLFEMLDLSLTEYEWLKQLHYEVSYVPPFFDGALQLFARGLHDWAKDNCTYNIITPTLQCFILHN